MSHLTYLEASVVGLIQGVTELFPVSSLGHNVLIPALVGGSWAQDLNVAQPESPYLAFIVGLHVATAIALLIYFWRDWIRIIGGFLSSIRDRRVETRDQRLAWMIILATIPVGLVGLVAEHAFRVIFGKPIARRGLPHGQRGDPVLRRAVPPPPVGAGRREGRRAAGERATGRAPRPRPGRRARHASGHQVVRQEEVALAVAADERLASVGLPRGGHHRRLADPRAAGRRSAGTASPW